MIILDSNIWIAYFYTSDTQHEKAEKLIRGLSFPIFVPEYVLGEVCTVLTQRSGKKAADIFIDHVTDSEDNVILPFENVDFQKTITLFRAYTKRNLSFVDMSLVLLAKTFQVLTFDEDLEKVIIGRK